MAELNPSVKTIMDILGKLDEYLDGESDANSNLEFPPVYEQIYRKIVSEVTEQNGDISRRNNGLGKGIAVLPGTRIVTCQETLLICMFPIYNGLGESYPNDVPELRLNEAIKYVEKCPTAKNVIFYGPVWDSILWKIHKESFSNCNSFLKLFFTVYTKLKK